ncbi:MAG: hypothetical protein M3P85_16280 [Actinomycetota bacterium]|nr:hypothetical protein [Actinomycetota bacterium]
MAHVRRPRLDYESHATGLDRNELGALLVAAGLASAREHALVSLLAINGPRVCWLAHPVSSPTLSVDRLVEEGGTVVAIGNGESTHKSGAINRFAFCDVFTFDGGLIRRVESYVVPVSK